MGHPTLVQFRSSHYNEKARWALDYKGVPHVRCTLLPGLHARALRRLTGDSQVPVLLRDGKAIADSTRILATLEESHPDPPLYPEDPAERERALALEDWFDEEIGPAARHAMFFLMAPHPGIVAAFFAGHRGPLYRGAYAAAFALQRGAFARRMDLTPEAFAASRARVEEGFARIEAELQPSGYLVGSRFGVADLTAAALLSIVTMPTENPHPPVIPPPPAVRAYWDSLASRPGARWVHEIYRKHRGASAALSE